MRAGYRYEKDLTIGHNVGLYTISCVIDVGSGEETKQGGQEALCAEGGPMPQELINGFG